MRFIEASEFWGLVLGVTWGHDSADGLKRLA
jgi:hypothetical protein